MGRRQKYDKEFKLNTLRLYEESNMNIREFEKEMGIGSGCLSHWKREFNEAKEQAFPGNGNTRDQEIAALKRKIELLTQERDILKKAVGIFSKPPGTGFGS